MSGKILAVVRCFIADIMYKVSGDSIKELLNKDINRNLKWDVEIKDKSNIYKLNFLLINSIEFRSIFYYRMKEYKGLCRLSRLFLSDLKTIEFGNGDIAGGLMVSHYQAVIFPKRAGKNFRVGPGVVIGRNGGDFPTIGDNVYIAANSVVIGEITIGNNCIIGAGSVVTKSVPDNSVCVGNPAKVIRNIDSDERLLNEIC